VTIYLLRKPEGALREKIQEICQGHLRLKLATDEEDKEDHLIGESIEKGISWRGKMMLS